MDEKDRTTEGRTEKVLRAADVMPPFREDGAAGRDGERKTSARWRGRASKSKRKSRRADAVVRQENVITSNGPDDNEIPTFDLAESILARQRRITAGRRKKRSPAAVAKDDGQTTAVPMYIDELSAQEQAELQQIVAGIVARDIQRLCRGSSRFLPV